MQAAKVSQIENCSTCYFPLNIHITGGAFRYHVRQRWLLYDFRARRRMQIAAALPAVYTGILLDRATTTVRFSRSKCASTWVALQRLRDRSRHHHFAANGIKHALIPPGGDSRMFDR